MLEYLPFEEILLRTSTASMHVSIVSSSCPRLAALMVELLLRIKPFRGVCVDTCRLYEVSKALDELKLGSPWSTMADPSARLEPWEPDFGKGLEQDASSSLA